MGRQGMLCADELCGTGVGDLEGERDGATTNYEERLVGLGDGEAAVGEGNFCLGVNRIEDVAWALQWSGVLPSR